MSHNGHVRSPYVVQGKKPNGNYNAQPVDPGCKIVLAIQVHVAPQALDTDRSTPSDPEPDGS